MAKQMSGYLGGFAGRLGPAVGYMWNGKWCVRSHQPVVHNPRTEAQTAHRTLFKQEVQLAARMRWAVTTALTDAARAAGMTSYNLFVSRNQHAFSLDNGAMRVDWRRLALSTGDVAPVADAVGTLTEDNVLEVSYGKGAGAAFDHVYLYVYAPTLEQGYLSAPSYRRERRIAVALPDEFAGCEWHAYLMVRHDDGRWSETVYVEPAPTGEQGAAAAPAAGPQPSAAATAAKASADNPERPHTAPPTDSDGEKKPPTGQ